MNRITRTLTIRLIRLGEGTNGDRYNHRNNQEKRQREIGSHLCNRSPRVRGSSTRAVRGEAEQEGPQREPRLRLGSSRSKARALDSKIRVWEQLNKGGERTTKTTTRGSAIVGGARVAGILWSL